MSSNDQNTVSPPHDKSSSGAAKGCDDQSGKTSTTLPSSPVQVSQVDAASGQVLEELEDENKYPLSGQGIFDLEERMRLAQEMLDNKARAFTTLGIVQEADDQGAGRSFVTVGRSSGDTPPNSPKSGAEGKLEEQTSAPAEQPHLTGPPSAPARMSEEEIDAATSQVDLTKAHVSVSIQNKFDPGRPVDVRGNVITRATHGLPRDYVNHKNLVSCECQTCNILRALIPHFCTGSALTCRCSFHSARRIVKEAHRDHFTSIFTELDLNAVPPVYVKFDGVRDFYVRNEDRVDCGSDAPNPRVYTPPLDDRTSLMSSYHESKDEFARYYVKVMEERPIQPHIVLDWDYTYDETMMWFDGLHVTYDAGRDYVIESYNNSVIFHSISRSTRPANPKWEIFDSLPRDGQAMLTAHPSFPWGDETQPPHSPSEFMSPGATDHSVIQEMTHALWHMTRNASNVNGYFDVFSAALHACPLPPLSAPTWREIDGYAALFVYSNSVGIKHGRVSYPVFFPSVRKTPILFRKPSLEVFRNPETWLEVKSYVSHWSKGFPLIMRNQGQTVMDSPVLTWDDFFSLPYTTQDLLLRVLSRYPFTFVMYHRKGYWNLWKRVNDWIGRPTSTLLAACLLSTESAQRLKGCARNVKFVGNCIELVKEEFSVIPAIMATSALVDYFYSANKFGAIDALTRSRNWINARGYYEQEIANIEAIVEVASSVYGVLRSIRTKENATYRAQLVESAETATAVVGVIAAGACLGSGVKQLKDTAALIRAIQTIYGAAKSAAEFTFRAMFDDSIDLPVLKPYMTDKEYEILSKYIFLSENEIRLMNSHRDGQYELAERCHSLQSLYKTIPFLSRIAPILGAIKGILESHPFLSSITILSLVMAIGYTAFACGKPWPTRDEAVELVESAVAPLQTLKGVQLKGTIKRIKGRLAFVCVDGYPHHLYKYTGKDNNKNHGFVRASKLTDDVVFYLKSQAAYIPLLNVAMLPETAQTLGMNAETVQVRVGSQIIEGRSRARPFHVKAGKNANYYKDVHDVDYNVTDDFVGRKVKGYTFPKYMDDDYSHRDNFIPNRDDLFDKWNEKKGDVNPQFIDLCKRVAKDQYGMDDSSLELVIEHEPLWWRVHCYMVAQLLTQNPSFRSHQSEALQGAAITDNSLEPCHNLPKPSVAKSKAPSCAPSIPSNESQHLSCDPTTDARKTDVKPAVASTEATLKPTKPLKETSSKHKAKQQVEKGSKPKPLTVNESMTNAPILPISKLEQCIFQIFKDAKCHNFVGTAFVVQSTLFTAGHLFIGSGYRHSTLYFKACDGIRSWSYKKTQVVAPDVIMCTDQSINAQFKHTLPYVVNAPKQGFSTVVGYYQKQQERPVLQFSTGSYYADSHNMSTIPGVSGAPIFNEKWEVFAIHLTGGMENATYPNGMWKFSSAMEKLIQDEHKKIETYIKTVATKTVPQAKLQPATQHGYEDFQTKDHETIEVWGRTPYVSTFGDKPVPDPDFQDFLLAYPHYERELKYTRAPRNLNAEGLAIYKFSRKFPKFQEDGYWSTAVLFMRSTFYPAMGGSELMSVQEVMAEVNKTSAPGAVWSQYKTAGELIEKEAPFLEEYVEQMQSENPPASLVKVSLKDELRPVEKAQEDKCRAFMVMSKEHYFCQARFSLKQNEMMTQYAKTHPGFPSAVGLSPIPLCSEIGKHVPYYHHTLCADVSGYDSNLPVYLFQEIAKFRYDCIHPRYKTIDGKKKLINLVGNVYRDVFYSPSVLMNGALVFLEHGPSGHASTTYDNTLMLYTVLAWVWLSLGGSSNVQAFNGAVRMYLYGDDSLMLFNNDVYSFFNEKSISDQLSTIGWVVEFSKQVEFLGHSIMRSTLYNAPVAVYNPDKLYASLWHKSTKTTKDLIMKANSLRLEAFSSPNSFEFLTRYVKWLVQRYGETHGWQEVGELMNEYFRSPYDEVSPTARMIGQSRVQKQYIQMSGPNAPKNQNQSSNSNPNPQRQRRARRRAPRRAKAANPATTVQVANLEKQVAKLTSTTKKQQNMRVLQNRASRSLMAQGSLLSQADAMLADRYAKCLVSPAKYPVRIPDSTRASSSLMVTSREIDVYVSTIDNDGAGRFSIMVQPKIGAPDIPQHFQVGMVNYSAGIPIDLGKTSAWQQRPGSLESVDPNSLYLTTEVPSFLAIAANDNEVGNLINRPLWNFFYNAPQQSGSVQITFNATAEEEAATRVIDGVTYQGSDLIIQPGTYYGVIRTHTDVATLSSGNNFINIAVFRGDPNDTSIGHVSVIEATGSTRTIQYKQFILSVTARDRVFVYVDPTTCPDPTTLQTTVFNLAPAVVPTLSWNQDEGIIDEIRPVGMSALFTPTMSTLLENGLLAVGRVPKGNLTSQYLSGLNAHRLDSITGLTKLAKDNWESYALKKGCYTYYAPADLSDIVFYQPSVHNEREYPFLIINGKLNVAQINEPSGQFLVGRLRVEFVYEFVHTTQLFTVEKTRGSQAIFDAANNRVSRMPVATENPSHGKLISKVGKAVGSTVDAIEGIFSIFG